MPRSAKPALHDILDAIDGIERAVEGKSFADFGSDWLLKRGVERGVEIISEATRRLPDELKAKQPDIPWRSIAGVGNVLRHEYHAISDKVIWDVIKGDLPPLKAAVEALASDLDGH